MRKSLKLLTKQDVKSIGIASLFLWGSMNNVVAAEPCESLSSVKEILACALQQHPAIQKGTALKNQAQEFENVASQRPNPELSSKVTYGKVSGDTILNTETSLLHTFELGGKRGSRIAKAVAEKGKVDAEFLEAKEEVFLKTLLSIYRLRQLQTEIKIVDEAILTFDRIQKMFKSRPKLGPEQTVSFAVFQLASGDYQLRKKSLEVELNSLERYFEIAIGKKAAFSASLLPPSKKDWPESKNKKSLLGSRLKLAESELKTAQSEKANADSEAWPDLKIGPAFETQRQGASSFQTYGVSLSIPLPLFQANGGGKALAEKGELKAQLSLKITERELEAQKDILSVQYKKAVEGLQNSIPITEVEKKHANMEHLFSRGLISASLVIEAHRQIFDFAKSQHEQELQALDALWRIRALEGSMFEEAL